MWRRRFSLIITVFLFHLVLSAQTDSSNGAGNGYYLGVRTGYGFLWAHRPTMSHLVNKHIPAVEVSIWKTTNLTKCWHQPYKNPQCGASITVIPLGDERLGTAIGLYPYVMFPLRDTDRKLTVNVQLGWGAGVITKRFDALENHQNNAIGSYLNTVILIRGTLKYECSDKFLFETGIGMTHFSNGAARMPNLGLNIPMIEAGVHFRIADANEVCDDRIRAKVMHTDSLINDRQWHLTGIITAGANDIEVPGGNRFGHINCQFTYMRNTARKHRFGGGVDVMYSQGVHHMMVYGDNPTTALQAVQVGVKGGYELVVGRLYLPIEIGVYAISKYKTAGMIYNRIAARYLVTDHLVLNLSLKTHIARAEYWEMGIGWRI